MYVLFECHSIRFPLHSHHSHGVGVNTTGHVGSIVEPVGRVGSWSDLGRCRSRLRRTCNELVIVIVKACDGTFRKVLGLYSSTSGGDALKLIRYNDTHPKVSKPEER